MNPGDHALTKPISGTLLAGAARVDITPATPQFLDGYANRTERSAGAYQPIFARALYVAGGGGEAVLVSAEVLAFDAAQVAQLRRAIGRLSGVPERGIILLATHTHCAPRVCGQMVMPGEIDAEYTASLG